jgi:hypothetical protein
MWVGCDVHLLTLHRRFTVAPPFPVAVAVYFAVAVHVDFAVTQVEETRQRRPMEEAMTQAQKDRAQKALEFPAEDDSEDGPVPETQTPRSPTDHSSGMNRPTFLVSLSYAAPALRGS